MLKEALGDESGGFSRSVEECACSSEQITKEHLAYLGPQTLVQVNSLKGNNQPSEAALQTQQIQQPQFSEQDPTYTAGRQCPSARAAEFSKYKMPS